MKRIAVMLLLFACVLSACGADVSASPEVLRDTDFGVSYVRHSGSVCVTGAATRYHGRSYSADLDELPDMLENTTLGAPESVTVYASSIAEAEEQIAEALEYVPDTISVRFSGVASADIDAFVERYDRWHQSENIDLFIRQIQTEDLDPLSLTRRGNTVDIRLVYSEGWLSYVASTGRVKVFEDDDYVDRLREFLEENVDPIKELNLTEAETVAAVSGMLRDVTDYDYDVGTYEHGSDDFIRAHSIYGALCGSVVCDGYSFTIDYILDYLGMYSVTVYSYDHAWNKVRIDGDWYNLDMASIDADYWLPQNHFLVSDNLSDDVHMFLAWADRLLPSPESHPDRLALCQSYILQ